MSKNIAVSFIIPAFNEENNIIDTLTQLHRFAPKVPYEVIIVDNGSKDNTIKLAQHYNDIVISCPIGTIAAVRNCGVKASTGKILVFLDADVKLTKQWQNNIDKTIKKIGAEPLIITGSRYSAPENNNNLNVHWFNLLVESNSSTYINSGHLITSRQLFDIISGFNEQLRTAEDYDFCVRGQQAGGIITPTPALKVIHDGYPSTYTQFIKRERWHGREDFKTFTSLMNSKVAIVICFHLMVFLSCFVFAFSKSVVTSLLTYIIIMSTVSLILTLYKYNNVPLKSLIKTSLIHYLYIIGRTLALIDRLTFRYSNNFR